MPDYEKAARKAARKYGVDPDVFVRQLRQESGLVPGKTSGAGAQGIAQFIPSTAKAYGVDLHDGRVTDDLEGAARYMRDNLKRAGGDYKKALSIYNSGRPDGYLHYGETANYVKNILNGKVPKASTGGGASSGNTSTRTTTTTTTPGVDNSGVRKQLLQQYLLQRGNPDALLSLGRGLSSAKDVPGSTSTTTTGSSGSSQKPANTGGHRPSGDLVATVQGFDRLAGKYGVPVTAKQEPGHAQGGDHDPAVPNATARDYGGDEASRRRLFGRITSALGVRGQYGGADINVVKNGIRYQIISRPHGTGPHLHVGMRKV